VDAKTTREDVRTVAALPALLPIVVITARPPPKGRDGGLRSNISALFVLRGNTKKAKPSKNDVIPKPSFFSLRYQLHALFCIIIIKERESDESSLLSHKHARKHTLLFSNSPAALPFSFNLKRQQKIENRYPIFVNFC
jgi:hypothetical protein